ncbi:aldolase [Sutcliffiella horikoshii]|uniref:Aldolase n=1 Tax=Sutcliffiella horikoshii TaxID=79883 RepID=A0AA94WSY4_9BACI|nr:aldolase [Sutcliffiella horikoshii]TYS60089.1 aldolase [Sutcliffiella horikoshii]
MDTNKLNKKIYKAFGLNILTEIPLPELDLYKSIFPYADISIKKERLDEKWNSLLDKQLFHLSINSCMFQVPQIAIFLIQNGNEIIVSPHEGVADDHIRLYLLGTCMGAILMQRRILPLHGSAIAINGKAYAIVGDSGAGKSTTASALLRHGYQLISDDVIPVSFNEQNIPMVTPAYPQQKLWQESIDEFGMESSNFRPIIDRETKFAIPVDSQFCDKQLPLAGVFELMKTEDEKLQFSSVTGLERFHLLFQHTYRNFFIPRAGLMDWHFQTSAKMVNKMSFYRIQRPTSHFTANEITDFILTSIERKGEVVNG